MLEMPLKPLNKVTMHLNYINFSSLLVVPRGQTDVFINYRTGKL